MISTSRCLAARASSGWGENHARLMSSPPQSGPLARDGRGGRPIRVLLTDDNVINRKVAGQMLEATGARVVHAENGEDALLAFQDEGFDIVFMDLQMPVMDGLTAIQLMRGHESNTGAGRTPIVVLSGSARPEHRQASALAGADAHLAKPITELALLDALAAALGDPV